MIKRVSINHEFVTILNMYIPINNFNTYKEKLYRIIKQKYHHSGRFQ